MSRFFLMCALYCLALGGLAQDGRVRWTDEVRLDREDRAVSLMQVTDSTFTFRHDRSSTEDMSGRGKLRSPCTAHDATCGSNCKSPLKSSVSQRPSRANRRDLLQETA